MYIGRLNIQRQGIPIGLPFNRRWTTRECECVFSCCRVFFSCYCDLGLDPMTLICELHLYILNMNEVSRSRLSKIRPLPGKTYRQTDATERITVPTFAGHNNDNIHIHTNINNKTFIRPTTSAVTLNRRHLQSL